MKASIICIGTELVTGRIVDTNSQYLARQLQQIGIYTAQIMQVEDNLEEIGFLLEAACQKTDYVFLTGGLGPTTDDLTKEAVAAFTGYPLELNEAVKQELTATLDKIYQVCPVSNYRQAYFPVGAQLLKNQYGTAPGFMLAYQQSMIISLPGPPRELIPMFQEEVLPRLKSESKLCYLKKELALFGTGESVIEDRLAGVMTVEGNPVLGIYASEGNISLVMTAWGEDEVACQERLMPLLKEVKQRIGEYIFSEANSSLEEIIKAELTEKNMNLSIAESCTGGQLAGRITALSGASQVFHSGYVTYHNEAKKQILGVPQEILDQFGAVSEETAMAMLKGLKNLTNTDCCLSITGIAGPEGGTDDKPVGLVYVGVNVADDYKVFQLNLRGNRQRIQSLTVSHALNFLRKELAKK